jgi:hypothetical protein
MLGTRLSADILLWLLELTIEQFSFNEAMRVLCDHTLLGSDTPSGVDSRESRGYGIHSCVHEWTKHWMNKRWDDRLANLSITCVA